MYSTCTLTCPLPTPTQALGHNSSPLMKEFSPASLFLLFSRLFPSTWKHVDLFPIFKKAPPFPWPHTTMFQIPFSAFLYSKIPKELSNCSLLFFHPFVSVLDLWFHLWLKQLYDNKVMNTKKTSPTFHWSQTSDILIWFVFPSYFAHWLVSFFFFCSVAIIV